LKFETKIGLLIGWWEYNISAIFCWHLYLL